MRLKILFQKNRIPKLGFIMREKSIIAAVMLDGYGFIGIGSNHNEGLIQLMNNPDFTSNAVVDGKINYKRMMMDESGNVIRMQDAWRIAEAQGRLIPLEERIEHYLEKTTESTKHYTKEYVTENVDNLCIDASHFKESYCERKTRDDGGWDNVILESCYDKAMHFADVHNKKILLSQKSVEIES